MTRPRLGHRGDQRIGRSSAPLSGHRVQVRRATMSGPGARRHRPSSMPQPSRGRHGSPQSEAPRRASRSRRRSRPDRCAQDRRSEPLGIRSMTTRSTTPSRQPAADPHHDVRSMCVGETLAPNDRISGGHHRILRSKTRGRIGEHRPPEARGQIEDPFGVAAVPATHQDQPPPAQETIGQRLLLRRSRLDS